MPAVNINGIGISYEVLGAGSRNLVITPGGRYSKDIVGIRELAERLVLQGFRVLLWDRPNCGASDICFEDTSESMQNANALAGLLRELGLAPACLIAGSGASREALLTAIHHPDVVERMFLFWISGGSIGLSTLAYAYYSDSAMAAAEFGMAAVAALPAWKEQTQRNGGNRERLMALDPAAFVEKMHAWGWAFFPSGGSPLPGIQPAELGAISKPVVILRSSPMDMHHTRSTSEAVQGLIPNSVLAEPPWGEREWPDRMRGFAKGESAAVHWPLLAPQIAEFARL
jgi:pimeloyl-ACP methyl ester carboxylesterase